MSYESDQDKWIREVNLKVGDKVLVVVSAESHANGWENAWMPEMSEAVGKTLLIEWDNVNCGVDGIACSKTDYRYPFFVLVKLEN
jgi:hypothetical protein